MKFKSKIIHFFLINVLLLLLVAIPAVAGIFATMMENQKPNFKIENGFGWALFCEGDAKKPCGFVEYTFVSDPPPILSPDFIELPLDTKVCKGNNCQCDFVNHTPCVCENPSCVTALNAIYTLYPLKEKNGLFEDGKPFSATMTKHDPVVCGNVTGDFFSVKAGCNPNDPSDDQTKANIDLDYRCQVIAIFDANNKFVDLSRSLAGTFVISVP
jgi:hypothetical protein